MNRTQHEISKSLVDAESVIAELRKPATVKTIKKISDMLTDTFKFFKGKVLICGNGGSACDAMHFAEELTGRFRKDRKALPCIALTDAAHITCVGNDYGFEYVFSRGVEALGTSDDVLIALSTSGNSKNIQLAVEQAKGKGMLTVCLLGKGGGELKGKANEEIIVDSEVSERIQEAHMTILHILVETIEREMFPENYED